MFAKVTAAEHDAHKTKGTITRERSGGIEPACIQFPTMHCSNAAMVITFETRAQVTGLHSSVFFKMSLFLCENSRGPLHLEQTHFNGSLGSTGRLQPTQKFFCVSQSRSSTEGLPLVHLQISEHCQQTWVNYASVLDSNTSPCSTDPAWV